MRGAAKLLAEWPRRTVTFGLDADLWAALEAYRVANCPEASVSAAARELVTAALARAPEAGTLDAARSEAMRGMQRWVHEKLQRFLADLAEESRAISG